MEGDQFFGPRRSPSQAQMSSWKVSPWCLLGACCMNLWGLSHESWEICRNYLGGGMSFVYTCRQVARLYKVP